MLRALQRNASSGEVSEGASTLTQQYVKNVFIEEAENNKAAVQHATRQTVGRKIRELKYAIQVEKELTKKQILENYLNITFFGEQAYGVETAAQRYFSRPAKDLDLDQAALLAGLVQSPSRYDPINNPEEAKKRRNTVLYRMAQLGDITQKQKKAAEAKPLGLKLSSPQHGCITADNGAAFFCDYVEHVFMNRPGLRQDPQGTAQALEPGRPDHQDDPGPEGAEVGPGRAAEPRRCDRQGRQRDHDGGTRHRTHRRHGTVPALRLREPPDHHQPVRRTQHGRVELRFPGRLDVQTDHRCGGAGKGISPAQSYTTPSEITVSTKEYRDCQGRSTGSGQYTVPNELDSEKGTFDMTSGLAQSINTYFVKLEGKTGLCPIGTMAKKMGVERGDGKPLRLTPSLTLGTNEVAPLTMANAYATFANRGVYCTPVAIESVTDASGKKLKVPQTSCSRAMSEHTADTVNTMLEGVVNKGTGTSAKLGDRSSAGKTGTTDSMTNAWFTGYTPDLATAVWVGSDGKKVKMYGINIGGHYFAKVCGGCLPAPIWHSAMQGALSGVPATSFHDVDVPRGKDKDKKKDDGHGGRHGGGNDGNPLPHISLPPNFIGGGANGGPGGGRGHGGHKGP